LNAHPTQRYKRTLHPTLESKANTFKNYRWLNLAVRLTQVPWPFEGGRNGVIEPFIFGAPQKSLPGALAKIGITTISISGSSCFF
jgi:hypothetical protein